MWKSGGGVCGPDLFSPRRLGWTRVSNDAL